MCLNDQPVARRRDGPAENHDLVPQLQAIKDVTAIKEVQPRRAQTRGSLLPLAWTSGG
jgi:hypothetical protein